MIEITSSTVGEKARPSAFVAYLITGFVAALTGPLNFSNPAPLPFRTHRRRTEDFGMSRWLVPVLILAAVGAWLLRASLAPLDQGIDKSVFRDPTRAAEPIERWLRPAPGGRALRPNIVVILADDLGFGDLAVQGSRAIETPHVDLLAAEGMRFGQFYSSAPLCSPALTMLQ